MTADSLWERATVAPDTLHRTLGGETILINLNTSLCFRLDETGNRIWELILELGDRARIVEQMVAEFDVDVETVRSDLDEFLGVLADKALVRLD